jgi:hypothetical protein
MNIKSRKIKHSLEVNQAFESVKAILYARVWHFVRTYRLPLQECEDEATYAFLKAFNWRWSPSKAQSFSSNCQMICDFRLRSLLLEKIKNQPFATVELDDELLHDQEAPQDRAQSLELIEDCSETAKRMVALVLDPPKRLITHRGRAKALSPASLLKIVKRHMIKTGVPREQVQNAECEIRGRFQEAYSRKPELVLN